MKNKFSCLVNLLDSWTVWWVGWGGSRSWEGSWGTTGTSVDLHHDWVGNSLKLLLLVLVLILGTLLVHVQPRDGLIDGSSELLLVVLVQLAGNLVILQGVTEVVRVRLKGVLGLDTLGSSLVVSLELLGISNHTLDLLLGETTLVVGDGDLVLLTSGLVDSRDVQDTVGINVEGDVDLWDTTWGRWDSRELELSEEVVVLGTGTLTFVDLDQNSWLVVSVGREGLRLLGWDGGVTLDQSSHDTSGSLNTEGEWGNIEEEQVLGLLGSVTSQDGGRQQDSRPV